MSLTSVLAIMLGGSLSLYAVLAGADFGAGVLDLTAASSDGGRSDKRVRLDRRTIAASIGPLWEANHVWLIFSITILFSAFPRAFSALGTALLAPLTVALLGLVVRGVALGVRAEAGSGARSGRILGLAFGLASVTVPFAFGVVAGGVAAAASSASVGRDGAPEIPWSSPFALLVGALAVALCAQLAACFVARRCVRLGDVDGAARFRARTAHWGSAALLLMALALSSAAISAPALWRGLIGPALPVVLAGFAAQASVLVASRRGAQRLTYASAVASVALVVWGWFIAQAPHLVGRGLTLQNSAAARPALMASAVAATAVLVIVLPGFVFLWTMFSRSMLEVIE